MERRERVAWISGLAVGLAAMYFLDPASGRRRRARIRDRARHLLRETERGVRALTKDTLNRTRGVTARAGRWACSAPLEDHHLAARVRAMLGRLCSRPGWVDAEVVDGTVLLKGIVPRHEIRDVLTGIRRIAGVRSVESRLEAVDAPARDDARPLPARAVPPALLRGDLSPGLRAAAALAGGIVLWAGLRRRDPAGAAAATLGGLLLLRGLTNVDPREWMAPAAGAGITVQKSLLVRAPLPEVFAAWTRFRDFPRFMQHLRAVHESEGGISHWVAEGPAGIPVSWNAEITALEPHRRIAWRSLEGLHAGEVRFEEPEAGATRIHVRMTYPPPAGAPGGMAAAFFGADPSRQLAEDLARFRSLMERDATAAPGGEARREPGPQLPG